MAFFLRHQDTTLAFSIKHFLILPYQLLHLRDNMCCFGRSSPPGGHGGRYYDYDHPRYYASGGQYYSAPIDMEYLGRGRRRGGGLGRGGFAGGTGYVGGPGVHRRGGRGGMAHGGGFQFSKNSNRSKSSLNSISFHGVQLQGYHAGISPSIWPFTMDEDKPALSHQRSFSLYTHTLHPMKWQEKTSKENRNQDAQGKPKCGPTASHTWNQPGTKSEAVMYLTSTASRSGRSQSLTMRQHLYRTILDNLTFCGEKRR
jgi:hypothetical protein